MTTYIKFLRPEGLPAHEDAAKNGPWFLPKGNRPGKWMPKIKEVIPCRQGYHSCGPQDCAAWIRSYNLPLDAYELEYRAEPIRHQDYGSGKYVGGEARLLKKHGSVTDQMLRLWACDCAEHVLSNYEKAYPGDGRIRDCIETVRRYARGEVAWEDVAKARISAYRAAYSADSADSAYSAAYSAYSAYRAADRAADRAAAYAARAADSADSAAYAARAADSADSAAEERAWQAERLMAYLTGEAK